ncbi:MAG: glycosyltransferase family 39 protein, partial [Sedimentisphaerales bacterium]|nr:glycosyltransferase family 39 protein [Sedimentisphaerales bacterium]
MARSNLYFRLLLLVLFAGALFLRLTHLDKRPLHTDEAVHAYKLGEHLEGIPYRYDPYEFHGPALHYFTLPVAWLNSADTFADLDEFTIRIIPALFGAALIILLWPLAHGLGRIAALAAALFTAISPAMVYYSRYYIME